MTPEQEELTNVMKALHDQEYRLNLDTKTDQQIYQILAWEFWTDGMDWDQGVPDIASGQYLPFNTRESAIRQLREVFGYR